MKSLSSKWKSEKNYIEVDVLYDVIRNQKKATLKKLNSQAKILISFNVG